MGGLDGDDCLIGRLTLYFGCNQGHGPYMAMLQLTVIGVEIAVLTLDTWCLFMYMPVFGISYKCTFRAAQIPAPSLLHWISQSVNYPLVLDLKRPLNARVVMVKV